MLSSSALRRLKALESEDYAAMHQALKIWKDIVTWLIDDKID